MNMKILADYFPLFWCVLCMLLCIGILVWRHVWAPPAPALFSYPYFYKELDVGTDVSPDLQDYIDEYLAGKGMSEIDEHAALIDSWKAQCREFIAMSKHPDYRQKQYDAILDDKNAYQFFLVRHVPFPKKWAYGEAKFSYGELRRRLSYMQANT